MPSPPFPLPPPPSPLPSHLVHQLQHLQVRGYALHHVEHERLEVRRHGGQARRHLLLEHGNLKDGRQAGRWANRRAGRQVGKEAGRQAGLMGMKGRLILSLHTYPVQGVGLWGGPETRAYSLG